MTSFKQSAEDILKSYAEYAVRKDTNQFNNAEMSVEFPEYVSYEEALEQLEALFNAKSEKLIERTRQSTIQEILNKGEGSYYIKEATDPQGHKFEITVQKVKILEPVLIKMKDYNPHV